MRWCDGSGAEGAFVRWDLNAGQPISATLSEQAFLFSAAQDQTLQHRMLGGGYASMENEYDQGYDMGPVSLDDGSFRLPQRANLQQMLAVKIAS